MLWIEFCTWTSAYAAALLAIEGLGYTLKRRAAAKVVAERLARA